MATEILPERRVARRKSSPDLVIDRQLRRTQFQVRIVDIVASLVVWLAAVLVALFLLAICDHWIVSIGSAGRWLALLALVAGSGYYIAVQLGPLLWRRINTAYAAKVIEDAEPSLKNSLLNFLLLRGNPASVPEVVVDALRDRAASDLTHTPVEQAVDRAPLIRLGYILCGVMVVFAAYKLLSPKDPFRTVARVLAPWADIARPSRVQIAKVQPGDKDVYQGQSVTITAEVSGQRSSDAVEVVYSTADGQTLHATAAMNWVAGMQYSAALPPDASDTGLQQDVIYRVKAGDAESPEFRLHVLPSPRIEVDRIELKFPRYTGRQPQTVMRQGDIRAVEGTQVTIHAKANQEIASASIEFDPTPNTPTRRANVLPMQVEGMNATAEFHLERLRDGAARHTSYQIRLVNRDSLKNDRPTIHRIEAQADLPPEIEVLAPMERRVELPADRTLKMELRGRDPDFGLCKIALELSKGEQPLEPATLFQLSGGQLGNTKVDYLVAPQKLGLQPGDELVVVGVAEDNRHDAAGEPAANINRTDRYVIHITAPEARQEKPAEQPMADKSDTGDKPPMPKKPSEREKPKPESKPNENTDKPEGDKPEESKPEEKNGNKNNTGNGSKKEEKKPGESAQEKSEPGDKGKNEKKSQQTGGEGGGKSEEQQEGGSEESDGSSGGETQGSRTSGSKPGSKSTGGATGNDPSGEPGSESESSEEGEGGTEGANSTQGGNKKTTSRKPSTSGEPGENTSEANDTAEPGETTGSDSTGDSAGQRPALDSEAIERINKELEKNPELKEKLKNENAGEKTDNENTGASAGTKPNNTGKPGEQSRPEQGTNDRTQEGAGNENNGSENNTGQPKPGEQANGAGKAKPQPGKALGEKPMPGDKPEEGEGDSATGEQTSDQGAQPGSKETPSPMNDGSKKPDDNATSKKPGQGDQGTAGSGEKPEKPNPAGQPQKRPQDREKNPKPNAGEKNSGEPSASPSSKKESDSTGATSGDQAGGGEQGPGQSAKQKGNDAPGSSSSADQGAGQSQEEGNGETGPKAGKGPKSERPTGQSGNEEGPGSAKQPGEKGSQPNPNESGDGAGNKAGSPVNPQRDPANGRPSGDAVRGGGKASEGEPIEGGPRKDVADTEAENLEFAKKSTDLALKYLKDQKDDPDPELLKKLGWTKEDLNAFLRRWEALKSSAKEGGEAKEELNDAYRSLGLRPAADKRRSAGAGDDAARGNRDAGARSEPPPGYAEQFKAFRKGAGK